MKTSYLALASLTGCLALIGAMPVHAADETNVTSGLTAAGKPLSMHGYDPVAFFTVGEPVEGNAKYAAVFDGATYYFASQQNLDAFEDAPEKFAPAFGGFCAFGVSVGKKFDGDPRFWTIAGGKLYLNLNQEIADKFKRDVSGSVAKAEQNWTKIQHAPVADL